MSPPVREELGRRLERVGRELAERELAHAPGLAEARACAEKLRGRVEAALACFHASASAAGAPHLRIELGEIRIDDKHLRSVQFDLARGRHRAVVTAKSRGEVTLVGPFQAGKQEGPCRSFPMDAGQELEAALGEFLERFAEAAATP